MCEEQHGFQRQMLEAAQSLEQPDGHTFEKEDSSKPAFSISLSLNSLPTSLSGRDSSSMPSAVSLACTGMPYSKSSRHTWHTFFAFATSWQMMVALYLCRALLCQSLDVVACWALAVMPGKGQVMLGELV